MLQDTKQRRTDERRDYNNHIESVEHEILGQRVNAINYAANPKQIYKSELILRILCV